VNGFGTLEALTVAVLALLPGAVYTWVYERQVSTSRAGLADRLLRLLGASGAFLALALPGLYQLYRVFVVPGRLVTGDPLPGAVWLLPPAYLLLPAVAGLVVGRAAHARKPWVRLLTGPAPAPRAWDHLFSTPKLTGWVRLKLMDGTWLFGAWSSGDAASGENRSTPQRSYAAGYPEQQDLYLVDTASVGDDGAVELDGDARPVMRGVGVLVRWDQVVYAEYSAG
jgi:hypothetical protein